MGKQLYPRIWMEEARKNKKLTTTQLAEMVGTTRSHIRAIEVGRRTPRQPLAYRISQVLDVDVGNFMRVCVQNEHETRINTNLCRNQT